MDSAREGFRRSFVVQEIALRRPALVRRLILASSAPKGAPRTYGLGVSAVGSGATAQSSAEGYLRAFFAPTATSQQAGKEVLSRLFARTDDGDENTDLATVVAQFEAARVWGMPDHSALERLQALEMPVLTANGDSDQMILTHNTYLFAGLIPQARVKIYPDSGHGLLFQHHAEFAVDVEAFLRS